MITLVNRKLFGERYLLGAETINIKGIGDQLVIGNLVKGMKIQIGNSIVTWDVCATDIKDDVILWLDFLEAQKNQLNLFNNTLVINEETISTKVVQDADEIKTSKVMVRKNITVPPNSVMCLPVKIDKGSKDDYIIQSDIDIQELLIANTVCKGTHGTVNIINDSNKHIKLQGGSIIGYAETIDDVIEENSDANLQIPQVSTDNGSTQDCIEELPDYLKDMFIRSKVELDED